MKLRDLYPSLEALCEDMDIDRSELEEKLKAVGYEYNEDTKRFW